MHMFWDNVILLLIKVQRSLHTFIMSLLVFSLSVKSQEGRRGWIASQGVCPGKERSSRWNSVSHFWFLLMVRTCATKVHKKKLRLKALIAQHPKQLQEWLRWQLKDTIYLQLCGKASKLISMYLTHFLRKLNPKPPQHTLPHTQAHYKQTHRKYDSWRDRYNVCLLFSKKLGYITLF